MNDSEVERLCVELEVALRAWSAVLDLIDPGESNDDGPRSS
jgi:hypothetical protein